MATFARMEVLAVLVLFVLVNCIHCNNPTTIVSPCDNVPLPEVQFVTNNTVCTQGPCIVRPGSDLILSVSFRSPKYLENIKPKIIAEAYGVKLDYPLNQDDACVGILNTYCPVVKDELVQYAYTMHLYDIFPEANVGLTFSLINKDDKTDVVCFGIDIQLKKTG